MQGDPIERKLKNGCIDRFHCLVRRGTLIETNQESITFFMTLSLIQTRVSFRIYYTKEYDAKYFDEPGMELLWKITIDLPGSGILDRLLFTFTFGQMEIA